MELENRMTQLVWNINGLMATLSDCDKGDPAFASQRQAIYANPNFLALRDWMSSADVIMPPAMPNPQGAPTPTPDECLGTIERVIDAVDRNADPIARLPEPPRRPRAQEDP